MHFQLTCSNENVARWPARWQILNPQPNPQNATSYATSAYFGSPRGLVSCCKTYSHSAVTAEAAGSSPVVPAIHSKRVALISTKPTGVQKGTFWCPFCTSFLVVAETLSVLLPRLLSFTLFVPRSGTLRLSLKKTPVQVQPLEPHAWPA